MNLKYRLQVLILVIYMTFLSSFIHAQEPLQYWRNPDAMIQDQAALLFEQAHQVLAANPPSTSADDARKLALFSIDALLHDTRLDNGSAFLNYIENRYREVVLKLQNEKPKAKEIRIYRLYNHGFIVQSPSVTIAIDLIRGGRAEKPFISDTLMEALVSRCDILLISHKHGDHADKSVAQMFCNQQKTVITPPGFWENMSPYIKYLRGERTITEKINIPAKNAVLTVKVFPGHQDDVINNVYAITTPESVTVMHTGDQYNNSDMDWITRVKEEAKVEVLLVHSWMPHIEKTVEGIHPKLIIVGHENEMEHTIDHRESYWLTFRRFKNVTTPYAVMAWGECYTFSK